MNDLTTFKLQVMIPLCLSYPNVQRTPPGNNHSTESIVKGLFESTEILESVFIIFKLILKSARQFIIINIQFMKYVRAHHSLTRCAAVVVILVVIVDDATVVAAVV